MVNRKNEHVFPRDSGWVVRREGTKKISRLFGSREDAMEYASIIALNDGGSVVTHKYNGQFKNFKHGNETKIRSHKRASIITGTVEIRHPVINNVEPIMETITLI